MTTTKEKPILFSGDMVRAILEGRKTQTRRLVKPQPPEAYDSLYGPELYTPTVIGRDGEERPGRPVFGVYSADGEYGVKCPYEVGMRLWIKTGYTTRYDSMFHHTFWSPPKGCGKFITTHGRAISKSGNVKRDGGHPGMFMPYWLSQELGLPLLEITDIRVQRVQETSEADAIAEGIEPTRPLYGDCGGYEHNGGIYAFSHLWNSINTKPGTRWEDNPWVWCVSFVRV